LARSEGKLEDDVAADLKVMHREGGHVILGEGSGLGLQTSTVISFRDSLIARWGEGMRERTQNAPDNDRLETKV